MTEAAITIVRQHIVTRMGNPSIRTVTFNRFVILHHLAPTGEHWDLMLEREAHLATWRMASQPVDRAASPVECTRIDDHRKRYLDYEGPVSRGRGVVTRVDYGRFELLGADDDAWILDFAGQRLTGHYRLARVDDDSPSAWILTAT